LKSTSISTTQTAPTSASVILHANTPQVLTVGAGMEFATLSDALKAAAAGDTIAVQAGTYTNDFGTVTANVTILAVGGLVHEVATEPPPDDKGILTVDANLTIEGVTFTSGSDGSPDGNVAGIRLQGGNLTASYCEFSNMQEGLLADPNPTGVVSIDHCEFLHNGTGDGLTHNLYVGAVQSLTVTNSFFEGANVGHEIKSRAASTTIENNVIVDGPTGTGSYDIDIPNGGVALIANNVIEKGPDASNVFAIHYGGETQYAYANNSLSVIGNVIINDMAASQAYAVYNQSAANGLNVAAQIQGNRFYNFLQSQIALGAAHLSGNTTLTANPGYSTQSPLNALPSITLASGPEVLNLTNGGHTVSGGAGLLTVTDTAGANTISGGAGGLNVTASGGWDQITTAFGAADTISTPGRDCVVNSQGNDLITAAGAYEVITASGQASITGSSFSTYDLNGAGESLVSSWSGFLNIGAAGVAQVLDTGGDLQLSVANGGRVAITDTAATVSGIAASTATISGGAASGWIHNAGTITVVTGSTGAMVQAGTGAVSVSGGSGNDTLMAGSGADVFILGGGNDRVVFGSGSASVTGGAGAETYVFNAGGGGKDTISGFKQGTDSLVFQGFAGNAVASGTIVGGSTLLSLSDGTQIDIAGVALSGYQGQGGGSTGGSGGSGGSSGGSGAITLTTTGKLVIGGAPPLSVVDLAGANTIEGGAGGLTVLAGDEDVLSTQAASVNQVTLGRYDTVSGAGTDHVTANGYRNVIAESSASTVSLLGAANTVQGGTGLLHITDSLGGNSITGGTGGMVAGLAGTGDTVTTAAGAADTVSLGAYGTLLSQGSDAVTLNGLYDVVTVTGASAVTAGSGYATYVLDGADSVSTAGAGNATIGGAAAVQFVSDGSGVGITKLAGGSVAVTQALASGTANATIGGGSATIAAAGGLYAGITVTSGGGASVFAGSGPVMVNSTGGAGASADTICAGSGNVTLNGGAGSLSFTGGAGHAQLHLGSGADTVTFGGGATTVSGGVADTFVVQTGCDGTATILNWTQGDQFVTPGQASPCIVSDSVVGGSTFLGFAGGAQIELVGVSHMT
jgi:hypothetical protein